MDFEELPYFIKKIFKLGLASKLDELKTELVANPQKGDIIKGLRVYAKSAWQLKAGERAEDIVSSIT